MNTKIYCAVILFCLCVIRESNNTGGKRYPASRGFLIYRTVSVTQKSCSCAMSYSCSCCRTVIILYTKAEKNLCVNFTYQRNGLNVDVSLNSDTIKTRSITEYKPFKFCVDVPGCLFSSACINILELNKFPRSITVCLRLDIFSKKQLWQINYDCVSIFTDLPTMPANATTRMMDKTEMTPNMGQMPASPSPMTNQTMKPTMMSMSMMMMPGSQMTMMTTMSPTMSTTMPTKATTEKVMEMTTEKMTVMTAPMMTMVTGRMATVSETMESMMTQSMSMVPQSMMIMMNTSAATESMANMMTEEMTSTATTETT